LQKTNQNVSTLFKILFSLPSNRFVLPGFHIVLFIIIQTIITFAYKGDLYLIPFGFVGVIFYLLVLRYLTGKRVSFSTIRRVSATHSFFLILTFLATVILVLLSKPLYAYISALSAVFSFSYVILRGEFLEGRIEPLVSLLFYYFFLLLPIYSAIEKSFNYIEIYFWITALVITAAFYYSVDRMTLNKLGVKLSKITQGVLDAWMVEYTEGFEKLLESNSIKIKTKTYCIKLKQDGSNSCIIIPPVHPGPFKGVGSYNITEVIAEHFKKKGFDDVIVLHSASNHDMNLPSKRSMMEYLAQLDTGAEEKAIKAYKVFKEEGRYFAYHGISTDVCDLVIIMPEDHIKALASFQKWVDSSISKTINMPSNITPEEVRQLILMAHDMGVKDLTVYRDKSLQVQVLKAPEEKEKEKGKEEKETPRVQVTAFAGSSITAEQETCPVCGSKLVFKEGCSTCPVCGWSACASS